MALPAEIKPLSATVRGALQGVYDNRVKAIVEAEKW